MLHLRTRIGSKEDAEWAKLPKFLFLFGHLCYFVLTCAPLRL